MSSEKNNVFRDDEIVMMIHVVKKSGEVFRTPYPKIGGRLRLAHEENGSLSIATEIIRYEEEVAVVKALATTSKGTFSGLGMASLERDQQIAPAILELAETRAIARSLRFAGYGVEYCSAEEVSHLYNGDLIEGPGESDASATRGRSVAERNELCRATPARAARATTSRASSVRSAQSSESQRRHAPRQGCQLAEFACAAASQAQT